MSCKTKGCLKPAIHPTKRPRFCLNCSLCIICQVDKRTRDRPTCKSQMCQDFVEEEDIDIVGDFKSCTLCNRKTDDVFCARHSWCIFCRKNKRELIGLACREAKCQHTWNLFNVEDKLRMEREFASGVIPYISHRPEKSTKRKCLDCDSKATYPHSRPQHCEAHSFCAFCKTVRRAPIGGHNVHGLLELACENEPCASYWE